MNGTPILLKKKVNKMKKRKTLRKILSEDKTASIYLASDVDEMLSQKDDIIREQKETIERLNVIIRERNIKLKQAMLCGSCVIWKSSDCNKPWTKRKRCFSCEDWKPITKWDDDL